MVTIYAGGKPIKGLGKNQFHLLSFALEHQGWHSVVKKNEKLVNSLVKKGLLEVNDTEQFRFNDTRGIK